MKTRELSETSVKQIDETIEKQKAGLITLFQKIEEFLSDEKRKRVFSEKCNVVEWDSFLDDLHYSDHLVKLLIIQYKNELDSVLDSCVREEYDYRGKD